MIDGKDRIRVEWVNALGHQQIQIIPYSRRISVGDGMFIVYVAVGEGEEPAIGVPVARLVRFAKLKDREEVDDEGASEDG
jgi:hypothetical protein